VPRATSFLMALAEPRLRQLVLRRCRLDNPVCSENPFRGVLHSDTRQAMAFFSRAYFSQAGPISIKS
jgi:hypothetical protein